MKLSIVIPNYKDSQFLKRGLPLIQNQNFKDYEIIVVEDGDYSKENAETVAGYDNAHYISNNDNLGFAASVNRGIKEAKGELVFLLNNDAFLSDGCLEKIVKAYEEISAQRNVFSVQCKMISDKDRNLIDNAGDFYNILGWARVRGKDDSATMYNERKDIFSACAGAALYRKDILEELGGFDENHFAYLEDVDLGYRARLNGYVNVFAPEAVVYHVGSATSGSRYNEFKVKLAARNSILVRYKNQTVLQKIINFPFMEAGVIIKQLYFLRKGLGKAYRAGICEGRRLKRTEALKEKKVSFNGKRRNAWKLELEMIRNLKY